MNTLFIYNFIFVSKVLQFYTDYSVSPEELSNK